MHQIVLDAFVGPCPEGMEVRHLDGTRTNNTPDNLAYGTRAENVLDKERHGTIRWALKRGHCAQGHPFNERNTGFDKQGRVRCRECARQKAAIRRNQA